MKFLEEHSKEHSNCNIWLYTITLCTKFLQVLVFVIFCVFFFQVSAIKFNKKFLLKNLLHYQIYTYKHHKLNLVTAIHLNWLFHSETKKGIHNSIQEYNVKFCDRVTHRIVPSNTKKGILQVMKISPHKNEKNPWYVLQLKIKFR